MFDDLNTEGYTAVQLMKMNEELAEELDKFADENHEDEPDNYIQYYKYACEKVLKRWDGA